MRKPWVGGNWKMNKTKSEAVALVQDMMGQLKDFEAARVAIFPPFVYLDHISETLKGSVVQLGGQNMSDKESGAYTGETAVSMLKDVGCQCVLIGHSERRQYFHETDALIAEKVAVAIEQGITPVLCIGETLEERKSEQTEVVIEKQLRAVLEKNGVESFKKMVVAYEPVWAIGTGLTATPEQAQEAHAFIRELIAKENQEIAENLVIVYGGSVKPDNAKEIFAKPDVDGGLIGGASLKAQDFISICESTK